MRIMLRRRLNRVRSRTRPRLKLAYIASRQLDLALLQSGEPEIDLESWLKAVADAAVIKARGNYWRFAHDKLREELQDSLSHDEHHLKFIRIKSFVN